MDNHYSSSKHLTLPKDQGPFQHDEASEDHIGESCANSIQENIDDGNLTSTRTNSMLLSAASNDILMECRNNYETSKNNKMANDRR